MNKAQFIEKLAEDTGLSRTQAEKVIDSAFEIIQNSVSNEEEVKFVGFGTFDHVRRKARNGRNPMTGESIQIPSSVVPRFRPGKEFKDRLADSLQ